MRTLLRLLIAAIAVAWVSPAGAQQSRCADCHFATPDAPNPRHVADWDRSPHARNDVGCEKCHGGNPDTFEGFPAHSTIIRRGDPECRTAVQNLPETCGRCHLGERLAFQKSHHAAMLKEGDLRAPSCATCHGDVAAYLPSPKQLESECRECHGPKAAQPRPEYVSNARRMLEDIADVRASLGAAKALIKRIRDKTERARFEERYRNAEVPVIETVREAHAFAFEHARERLGVARQRAAALLDSLANPRAGASPVPSRRQER